MNIISITAEMAGMEKSTPESRRLARDRIGRQVDRISDLVNEIMEFTQGSHDAFVPWRRQTMRFFCPAIGSDEIRPEIEIKSATIALENPPPPVKLLLDPKRLCDAFSTTLIHNATDAMSGGGKILVRFNVGEWRSDHGNRG